jgi:hypothetical protein
MHGGAVSIPSRATCVVWHAKHASAPSDLVAALQRPGFDRADCDSVFAVVARIGLLRRAAPVAPIVLLLVDPSALKAEIGGHLGGLLAVLDRIAPGLVLWAFTPGTNPAIRQVSREELLGLAFGSEGTPAPATGAFARSSAAAPHVVVAPRYQQPTPLKLSGSDEIVSNVAGAGPSLAASSVQFPEVVPAASHSTIALRISDEGFSNSLNSNSLNNNRSNSDQNGVEAGASLSQSSKPLLSDEELAMLLADDSESAENTGA